MRQLIPLVMAGVVIGRSPRSADALVVANDGSSDLLWTAPQRTQLTYCISNAFAGHKADVVEAMVDATERGWEMLIAVDFIYKPEHDGNCTEQNQGVLFNIVPIDVNKEYLARSFFPNAVRANRKLTIDWQTLGAATNIPLPNVLAHELGHVLGFKHEHTREGAAKSCFEDLNFRPLTNYDPASVMHYSQCGGVSYDLVFSQLDRLGAQQLYGAPASNPPPLVQFRGVRKNDIVVTPTAVTAQAVDADVAEVSLTVDGKLLETKLAEPYTFTLGALPRGPHLLRLEARDVTGQVTTRELQITVGTQAERQAQRAADYNELEQDDYAGGCQTGMARGLVLPVLAGLRRRRHAPAR